MAINFFCEDVEFVLPKKATHRNWLKEVAVKENKVIGNINFIFSSDDFVLNINKKYLNHDYFTDVITFDDSDRNRLNGDIFISIDTVKKNSEVFECSFLEEVDRVMVHGLLHLIGYKDGDEDSKSVMRKKEDNYIQILLSNFIIN